MTWVMPRARGFGGRAGRSRKSGDDTPGNLTAAGRVAPAREHGGRRALDAHRYVRERPVLPLAPQEAEDVDVVVALAMAVPVAQHPLVAESDSQQRLRRLHVRRVRVRAEAVQPEHAEGEAGDHRLRLAVDPRAPEAPGQPRADDAAPVARGELRQPGDARRAALAMDDEQVELLAALPPGGGLVDVPAGGFGARGRGPPETPPPAPPRGPPPA